MTARKRPLIHRIRTLHRWISLSFTVIAVALIIDLLVNETATESLSLLAVIALVLLLVTGGWMLAHHYLRGRGARHRAVHPTASRAAVEPD